MFKLFSFVIIWLFFGSISYGNNIEIEDAIDLIFENAQSSIERIVEGRVFFNVEKVWLANGKIYVEAEKGEPISLPRIFSDDSGLFLETMRKEQDRFWICKKCSWAHAYEPVECDRCDGRVFIIRYGRIPASD